MFAEHHVLLLSEEQDVENRVRSALESTRRFGFAETCTSLGEVRDQLTENSVSAVLVDGGSNPERFFGRLESLIPQFPHTRFLVISDNLHDELVFEAMQIGARHIMTRESVGSQLSGVLQRLIPNGLPGMPSKGHAVLVVPAGGGCGATTIACNVSNELGKQSSEPALFVDLDWHYGGGSVYMGLDGEYGVADVLNHGENMDGYLVRSSAVEYSSDLDALLSPAAIDFGNVPALPYDRLEELVSACKRAYSYTVLDLPRIPLTVYTSLTRVSHLAVIVFELTLKSVRIARDTRTALIENGADRDQIMFVANRCRWRTPVSLSEARDALGGAEPLCVKDKSKHAIRSMNQGELLSDVASRSRLRRDIRGVADKIMKRIEEEAATE